MISILSTLVSNLFLWLWAGGLLLLWHITKKRRKQRRLGLWVFVALWVAGTQPVGELVLLPLEAAHDPPTIASLKAEGVSRVVVLTGGGYPVRGELKSVSFPPASMARFTGGMELCGRLGPDCLLIFSGAAGRSSREISTARAMEQAAKAISPEMKTVSESRSGSTAEHPENVGRLVGSEEFVLVTSAYHLPRAMQSFERSGMGPVAWPLDYQSRGVFAWHNFLPSFEGYRLIGIGLREYIALLVYTLSGW